MIKPKNPHTAIPTPQILLVSVNSLCLGLRVKRNILRVSLMALAIILGSTIRDSPYIKAGSEALKTYVHGPPLLMLNLVLELFLVSWNGYSGENEKRLYDIAV